MGRAALRAIAGLARRVAGTTAGRRAYAAAGGAVARVEYGWGPRIASRLRREWILFKHPHANIEFQGPVHIGRGFSLYMPHPSSSLVVGPDVEFRNGVRIEIVRGGRVVIGARCVLSYDMLIQCTSLIEIGEGTGLGQSCAIYDGNHRYRDLAQPFMTQGFDLRPIRIGRECGVLTKTTIINDVGDRCIVGANSVVVKAIPSYCVAAGVPARVIDYFGPPGDEPAGWSGRSSRAGDGAAAVEAGESPAREPAAG